MAKTKRKHKDSKADKKRRGRNLGTIILGALGLLFIGFLIDRTGPEESLVGEVVETRNYEHNSGDQQGSHTHVEAIIEFEGKRHTLSPADRLRRGDRVYVLVRRGRFTGYAYFVSANRGVGG